MAQKDLGSLFHDGLRDLYYAERKILSNLKKLARGAQSEDLKQAFQMHQDQTEGQIERLQQVFEMLGKPARGKTCPSIDGIIDEGEEMMDEYKGTPAVDAAIIAAAQAVEHYEICRYGTLKRWATVLGMEDAAQLLAENEKEEIETDELLTKSADESANQKALETV